MLRFSAYRRGGRANPFPTEIMVLHTHTRTQCYDHTMSVGWRPKEDSSMAQSKLENLGSRRVRGINHSQGMINDQHEAEIGMIYILPSLSIIIIIIILLLFISSVERGMILLYHQWLLIFGEVVYFTGSTNSNLNPILKHLRKHSPKYCWVEYWTPNQVEALNWLSCMLWLALTLKFLYSMWASPRQESHLLKSIPL